jgi:hypothetical protein
MRSSDVSVSLTKGGNVSLTKQAPDLAAVIVGLGWDVRSTTGTDFDLDRGRRRRQGALRQALRVLQQPHHP